MAHEKSRPGNTGTALLLTDSDTTNTDGQFDFDKRVVDQVDLSLWRAIFDGHFRLAVSCDVCGRWLTAGRSKRNHRGPRCAAKAGA